MIKQAAQLIKDNIIVKHYAGSIAYGTNLPTSDTDFRGIFVGEPINIRTPFFRIDEAKDMAEEDTVIYELSQFMKLAMECNPNVIESLWVDESDVVFTTDAYKLLRSYASQLLCSNIAFTTSGYACAQLKRIRGHNKWINNPQPIAPPQQVDYMSLIHNFTGEKVFKINLHDYHTDYRLVPYSDNSFGVYPMKGYETFTLDTGNLNTTYGGDSHTIEEKPIFIIKFNKHEYNSALDIWNNYWSWKKNRNVLRGALEEDFGYDCKHAMHLVRLLRMGEEALTTGEILVKRPDAKELLEIRNGAWTYDELVEYADEKDNYIRNVLYKQTNLPKTPDYKLGAKIMMEVQDLIWSTK
jgi:predicted nucleotidyltransferase